MAYFSLLHLPADIPCLCRFTTTLLTRSLQRLGLWPWRHPPVDTTIVGVDITAFGPFSRNLAPESSLDEWTAEAFRDAVEDASLAKNGVCRVLRLTGVAGAPLLVGRDDAMGVLGMQPSP